MEGHPFFPSPTFQDRCWVYLLTFWGPSMLIKMVNSDAIGKIPEGLGRFEDLKIQKNLRKKIQKNKK